MPISQPTCLLDSTCSPSHSSLAKSPCAVLPFTPLPLTALLRHGLSRIELSVCVVVIGVLTSLLLPRISEWQAEGRAIHWSNAIASVNRAVVIFQAECSRSSQGACNSLQINGQTIAGANGHAAASPDGIVRLAGLPAEVQLREHLVDGVPAITMSLRGPATALCSFTYVQAPMSGTAPVILSHPASCP